MSTTVAKVSLRQKPITKGRISLFLDYYPAIRSPRTGRKSRREFLGIYVLAAPRNVLEREYNKAMFEKAELIRCRRQESVINGEFGFIDRHQESDDFLAYFKEMCKKKYDKWEIVYRHFENFVHGKCTFGDVTVDLCKKFGEYLMTAHNLRIEHQLLSRNSVAGYFSTFRGLLKIAYRDKLLKENINDFLEKIEWEDVHKEFLTQEELITLANTPCKHPVLRKASLFSCLTGLRISDIENLTWENIQDTPQMGIFIRIRTQKTKTEATLPSVAKRLNSVVHKGKEKCSKVSNARW